MATLRYIGSGISPSLVNSPLNAENCDKPEIEPHGMGNDFSGKAMAAI